MDLIVRLRKVVSRKPAFLWFRDHSTKLREGDIIVFNKEEKGFRGWIVRDSENLGWNPGWNPNLTWEPGYLHLIATILAGCYGFQVQRMRQGENLDRLRYEVVDLR